MNKNKKSDIDKRSENRRSKLTNPFHPYYALFGRRQGLRRLEDEPYFLDRYDQQLFMVIMLIIVLSLVDAFFTIYFINAGVVVEFNPIMDSAITISPVYFVITKLGLTFLGILLLIFHKRRPMVTMIIAGVVCMYLLITLYHLYILFVHATP